MESHKSASKFTQSGKNLTSLTGNLYVTDRALIINVRGRNFLGGLQDSVRNKKSLSKALPWKEEHEEKAVVV